jgi:hypothetical protein
MKDGGGDRQEDGAEQEEDRGEVREYQENTRKVMEGLERPKEHGDGWNLRWIAAAGAVVEEDFVTFALSRLDFFGWDDPGAEVK